MSETVRDVVWMHQITSETGMPIHKPTPLPSDNALMYRKPKEIFLMKSAKHMMHTLTLF